MIPAGGVLRIAAALALPVTIAGVVFVLLAASQALAVGAARRARRLAMGGALAVLLYGGLLIGASLASSEVGLEPGQEKSFCGLDCDLKFSVTRLLTVPPRSPGSRAFYLTLRARSDARAVSIAPASLHAWLVSADGRQFDPASGRGVRIREPIAPGALVDVDLRFEVPAGVPGLRLAVTEGGPLTRLVIGDENSYFHRKTVFLLPEPKPARRLTP